jgi:ABC-type uncharacterized transport system permease subunit
MNGIPGAESLFIVMLLTIVSVTAFWIIKGAEFRRFFNRKVADIFSDIVGYIVMLGFAIVFIIPLYLWIASPLMSFAGMLSVWFVGFTFMILMNGALVTWCSMHEMIARKYPVPTVTEKQRKKLKIVYE